MAKLCSQKYDVRLNVALIGVDAKMAKALEFFFNGPAKGLARLTSVADAHIDLVNISELLTWKLYRKIQKRPCIVLSRKKVVAYDAVWVPKPLHKSELLKAVKRVGQYLPVEQPEHITDLARIQSLLRSTDAVTSGHGLSRLADKLVVSHVQEKHGLCGELDDEAYLTSDVESWGYKPDKTLQSTLYHAVHFASESGRCIRLEGLPGEVMVLAGGRFIYSGLSDDILQQLCGCSAEVEDVRLQAQGAEFMVDEQDVSVRRSEEYLWLVSLLCSRGRVPDGYSVNQPLKLAAYPNFSRVPQTPHAVQVATLWCRGTSSALQIARELDISLRYVVGLLSACAAAGLFEAAENEHLPQTGADGTSDSGLIRRFSGLLFR